MAQAQANSSLTNGAGSGEAEPPTAAATTHMEPPKSVATTAGQDSVTEKFYGTGPRPQLSSSLESLISCPVCFEVFQEPKSLSCGHTLCLSCVTRLFRASHGRLLKCPLCRQVNYSADNRLRPRLQLPTNMSLKNLISALKSDKNSDEASGSGRCRGGERWGCGGSLVACETPDCTSWRSPRQASLSDLWRCEDCAKFVCSTCVVKSHRNHAGVVAMTTHCHQRQVSLNGQLAAIRPLVQRIVGFRQRAADAAACSDQIKRNMANRLAVIVHCQREATSRIQTKIDQLCRQFESLDLPPGFAPESAAAEAPISLADYGRLKSREELAAKLNEELTPTGNILEALMHSIEENIRLMLEWWDGVQSLEGNMASLDHLDLSPAPPSGDLGEAEPEGARARPSAFTPVLGGRSAAREVQEVECVLEDLDSLYPPVSLGDIEDTSFSDFRDTEHEHFELSEVDATPHPGLGFLQNDTSYHVPNMFNSDRIANHRAGGFNLFSGRNSSGGTRVLANEHRVPSDLRRFFTSGPAFPSRAPGFGSGSAQAMPTGFGSGFGSGNGFRDSDRRGFADGSASGAGSAGLGSGSGFGSRGGPLTSSEAEALGFGSSTTQPPSAFFACEAFDPLWRRRMGPNGPESTAQNSTPPTDFGRNLSNAFGGFSQSLFSAPAPSNESTDASPPPLGPASGPFGDLEEDHHGSGGGTTPVPPPSDFDDDYYLPYGNDDEFDYDRDSDEERSVPEDDFWQDGEGDGEMSDLDGLDSELDDVSEHAEQPPVIPNLDDESNQAVADSNESVASFGILSDDAVDNGQALPDLLVSQGPDPEPPTSTANDVTPTSDGGNLGGRQVGSNWSLGVERATAVEGCERQSSSHELPASASALQGEGEGRRVAGRSPSPEGARGGARIPVGGLGRGRARRHPDSAADANAISYPSLHFAAAAGRGRARRNV